MKKVYTCFCAAFLHKGHRNIIARARELGEVTVGVLSDEAMIRYNRFPSCSLEERLSAARSLEGVSHVVVQHDMMYDEIIATLRPDIVIHGDNWCRPDAPELAIRQNVEACLAKYGGTIVDVPYTYDPEAQRIDALDLERLAMPEYRRRRLRQLIGICPLVKVLEAHSGLSGLIAERTVVRQPDGRLDQFDAMCVSSLCDSTAKGKPDIELGDMSARLRTIDEIMEVTTKPIIFDGGTGGLPEHFVHNVRSLERIGVSAVVINDNCVFGQNSFSCADVVQTQDFVDHFCAKIASGKNALRTREFMIVARCESLVHERGMDDALSRCHAYVAAGADAIMIHSRQKDPDELFGFCARFRALDSATPIFVLSETCTSLTEKELAAHGVNVCIYPDQLTRASVLAMQSVANDLLIHHRILEADSRLLPFSKIIRLIEK